MYGVELGHAHTGGSRVGLVRHAAGLRVPRHDHDRACLHVVLRGVYVECSEDRVVAACAGDLVAKPPGAAHENRFGTYGAESLRFELGGDDLRMPAPLDGHSIDRALARRKALVHEARVSGEPIVRRPGTQAGTPRGTRARVSPQARLLVRLRRDFRERLSLRELARDLGVHRSHLTRQFTLDFGCSPQTYVLLRRVAWAAERLPQHTGTLAGLAADAGFADQSHFTRTFKRVFGSTPRHWERDGCR